MKSYKALIVLGLLVPVAAWFFHGALPAVETAGSLVLGYAARKHKDYLLAVAKNPLAYAKQKILEWFGI